MAKKLVYGLNLTFEETQYVLNLLKTRPLQEVLGLYNKILSLCNEQEIKNDKDEEAKTLDKYKKKLEKDYILTERVGK